MSTTRIDLLTPVGRLVMGSLYEPQTTDADNRPLTIKTGPNAGQPMVKYFFALAIPKGSEQHWSSTEWGAKIWSVGHNAFTKGEASSPKFAWKIVDGDSTIPNSKNIKPCDREGYLHHWVLSFSSAFKPQVFNSDGSKQIMEDDAVNLGDYVQVYGSVDGNDSSLNPGIYLNHQLVALIGYGDRIQPANRIDPTAVGFGGALPPGASLTPKANGFNPNNTTPPIVPLVPSAPIQPVVPYPQILSPAPVAPVSQKIMLPKANGITYDQYIAAGYTDQLLIQHGLMKA